MNMKSFCILSISGIRLDKKGHGFIRFTKNRGLEKAFLIQYQIIS